MSAVQVMRLRHSVAMEAIVVASGEGTQRHCLVLHTMIVCLLTGKADKAYAAGSTTAVPGANDSSEAGAKHQEHHFQQSPPAHRS